MNDKERLIELLEAKYDHYCDQCGVNKQTNYIENLADYLIANGVTIQERGEWFVYRCPKCNGSGIDYSEIKKPREIKCPNCGAKMDLEG